MPPSKRRRVAATSGREVPDDERLPLSSKSAEDNRSPLSPSQLLYHPQKRLTLSPGQQPPASDVLQRFSEAFRLANDNAQLGRGRLESHEGSTSQRQASTSSETVQGLDVEIIAEDRHRVDLMQSIQVDLPRFLSHISVPTWQSRTPAREERASSDTYPHHLSSPHSMLPDTLPLPHPALSDNIWSMQARRLDTPPWQDCRQQVAVKAEEEEESIDAEVDGGALDGFSSDEFVYNCQSSPDWSNASPGRWQHTLPHPAANKAWGVDEYDRGRRHSRGHSNVSL